MSGFIKLTEIGDDPPICINVKQITYFFDHGGYTVVLLSNRDFVNVKESPETIEKLISKSKN